MKIKLFAFLFTAIAVGFVSCGDDDDNFLPDDQVANLFASKYPDAKSVSWESKLDYKVADFIDGDKEAEAWFDSQGQWVMTETDVLFNELPTPVQEHFVLSQYANWKIDDVDMIERYNAETIYVIEVEKGEADIDLYYTADGTLIKEKADGGDDDFHKPLVIKEALVSFIEEKYPGAKILEFDEEKNGVEVDIIHNNISKDVYFDATGAWVRTAWDIRRNEVPAAVMDRINTDYSGYEIDDIELHETPSGLLYKFELESGETDIEVYVTIDGTLSNEVKD